MREKESEDYELGNEIVKDEEIKNNWNGPFHETNKLEISLNEEKENGAPIEKSSNDVRFIGDINGTNSNKNKDSARSISNDRSSIKLNKTRKDNLLNKRHLNREDLENRERSKLACLVRKKYTALMKESIRNKGFKKNYYFCNSLKSLSSKIIYELTGQIFQAIISVLSVVLYIVSTYYPDYSELDKLNGSNYEIVNFLFWFEFALAVVINIDWVYNLIIEKRKKKFLFNFLNILDLIIFVSVYANLISPYTTNFGFIRIFRVIRIMRIFRLFKFVSSTKKDNLDETRTEINRRLIYSVLFILAVIFVSTGIIHFLNDTFPEYFRIVIPILESYECASGNDFVVNEFRPELTGIEMELECAPGDVLVKKNGVLTFDLAFYYMVITMATVGYGDIYPDTSWMRLVIGIFVIISIITISKQTSELNEIIKLRSHFQVPYSELKGIKHVILTGFFNKSSLIRFLNEFYHDDHKEKSQHIKIIIIQNEYPDKEIQSILLDPKYEESLHFIQGDIFSEIILKLAKTGTAEAIILVSDHNHDDAAKNDQFLILACKAFSQFSQSKIYVQFKYSQSLLHDWADWDIACSSSQIKMSMIAMNGFISGFATMMMNLSSSLSSVNSDNFKMAPWMHEYLNGASQEIYIVNIPENFEFQIDFTKFILKSYLTNGTLVIGVKKKVYYQDDRDIFYFLYLLNPINPKIEKEDALIVISNDYNMAKSIFNVNKKKSKNKITKYQDPEIKNRKEEEKFNYFINNIKDENMVNSSFYYKDSKERKKTFSRISSNFLITSTTNIPKIFQEEQHFKIWENNPEELELQFKNHYLIFCKEEYLWEFMKCFDTLYSDIIFFICDHHPSTQWEVLMKSFRNLIFIECSYSDFDDLKKLGLEKAKHVFILTHAVENSNVSDSGILPLVKLIEENFPKCKYTLELADELNIRYLSHESELEGNYFRSVKISKDAIGKKDTIKREKEISTMKKYPIRLWPKFAKSDIFFSSSLDSIMAFAFHNDGVLEVIMKILGLSSMIINKNIIENAKISMYRYVGTQRGYTYKNVIKNFLKVSPPIIPIAVYRTNTGDKILKNDNPYIITNPKKDLDLNTFDKVICIGNPSDSIFKEFKNENYYFEEERRFGEASDEFEEKNNIFNVNEKKSKIFKSVEKTISPRKILKNLDENQLIDKLKEELRNIKKLSKESDIDLTKENDVENVNTHKNLNSSFKIIEEENYEINEMKDELESSADEEKSIILKNNITEFNNSKDKFFENEKDIKINYHNKIFSIDNVERFDLHGVSK